MTSTDNRPDFSPEMLRGFLQARIVMVRRMASDAPGQKANAERGLKAEIRKRAGVSQAVLDQALAGRLLGGVLRGRIWAALDADPAVLGITLLDDGTQVRGDRTNIKQQGDDA